MRRWMAAPLVFAVALGLSFREAPQAAAQPAAGPTAESFRTADGVELHGLFHTAQKNANNAPVVVFLYPPGPDRDMTKGDWGALAKELTKEGYHVFQFDWRGHGKSTSIKDTQKFWTNPYLNARGANFNGWIRGGPPKMPLKNQLLYKDLGRPEQYLPAYLNDLAAVRLHLDLKNDKREVNTSSIYLIGAGDAATLGMAWLASEWKRPDVMPNVAQLGGAADYEYVPQQLRGGNITEAGNDIAGAVWLTPTRPTTIPARLVQSWVSNPNMAPKIRDINPMLFLYADKDTSGNTSGKKQAEFFYNEVLVAEPRKGSPLAKLNQTFLREVKDAAQLQGVGLLDPKLKTIPDIMLYFAAIKKVRDALGNKTRDFKNPYFIDVRHLGLRTQ